MQGAFSAEFIGAGFLMKHFIRRDAGGTKSSR
jgi:hypothetical protein